VELKLELSPGSAYLVGDERIYLRTKGNPAAQPSLCACITTTEFTTHLLSSLRAEKFQERLRVWPHDGGQPSRVLPASKKSDVCCAYPLSTTKTPMFYFFLRSQHHLEGVHVLVFERID
jgi:hypothetical protein